jgi:hypothetical protein
MAAPNPIGAVPAPTNNGTRDVGRLPASPVDLKGWRQAEDGIGRALSRASAALARLDERLSISPHRDALISRIALLEVCDLSWIDGADIPIERLALYRVSRTGAGQGDARGLLRADWAIRRLIRKDVNLGDRNDLVAFLGLSISADPSDALMDLIDRNLGPLFVSELDTWIGILIAGDDLHPLTRAAIGFQFWRFLELSSGTDMIEPAVIAARLGAEGCTALPFVPFAYRNRRALAGMGPHPHQRLPVWFERVEASCVAVRAMLESLDRWESRAQKATAGMSGKTPARLIEALITHPVVSSRMLVEDGSVSPGGARAFALRRPGPHERSHWRRPLPLLETKLRGWLQIL